MAWPPSPLPVNFTNNTVSLNTHPTAHNDTNQTINDDIVPQINAMLEQLQPVGSIIDYAGTGTPPGRWLLCDGRLVLIATYPALYAAIGQTWGGSGTETFNLPNLTNRSTVGATTPGGYGGSADTPVVSHTHGLAGSGAVATDAGNHTHAGRENGFVYWDTAYNTNQSATTPVGPNAPWALNWQTTTEAAGTHNHGLSGSTQSAGGTGTGTNYHPYANVRKFIKY